jgi:HEAT repeat protein
MNDRTMTVNWPSGWDGALATRFAAARAVWKISGETNGPAKVFGEGLKSTDVRMRNWSCSYLYELNPHDESLIPVITGVLQDALAIQELSSELSAVALIGTYGPAAREAVPVLIKMTSAQSPELRTHALQALKKIDPAVAAEYEKK